MVDRLQRPMGVRLVAGAILRLSLAMVVGLLVSGTPLSAAGPVLEAARAAPHVEARPPWAGRADHLNPALAEARSRDNPRAGRLGGVRGVPLSADQAACIVSSDMDDGDGSLRRCLERQAAGTRISFDPVVFPPSRAATITLESELPPIRADAVQIDASDNQVVLDGRQLAEGTGLTIAGAAGVAIRGLQIVNFPWEAVVLGPGTRNAVIGGSRTVGTGPNGQGNVISGNAATGVWIDGLGTRDNVVQGNLIGTDPTGQVARGNEVGVVITDEASGNTIGGTEPSTRNVISGNTLQGIIIQVAGTKANRVIGNYIGTNLRGDRALPNRQIGIALMNGATENVIGGREPGEGNVLSGNIQAGIWVGRQGTSGNQVIGNRIGTDASGDVGLGNKIGGVVIAQGATANVIGGSEPGAGNLISGNGDGNASILGAGSSDNRLLGNRIGTDATASRALENTASGVIIGQGATRNLIGAAAPGAGNIISGNRPVGVLVQGAGTDANTIEGNFIGTDLGGVNPIPNSQNGVVVLGGAMENVIGGTAPGAGNVISGNALDGVSIQNAGSNRNRVQGNRIGVDSTGGRALPNGNFGVQIADAAENVIGGVVRSARNIISGNGQRGVVLHGRGTTGNLVAGNYVGLDASGQRAVGNGVSGVDVTLGASGNIIGDTAPAGGNFISGNGQAGVTVSSAATEGNRIIGNVIGLDVAGGGASGNGVAGVALLAGARANEIGGREPGSGNVISGNGGPGVLVQGQTTDANLVYGNRIGTGLDESTTVGNRIGISLEAGAQHNRIGGDSRAGNVITGNREAGVAIEGRMTLGNPISRNAIHHNGGLAIDFVGMDPPTGPLAPPVLRLDGAGREASGRSCAGCVVELFANPDGSSGGTQFLVEAMAEADGSFSAQMPGTSRSPFLSATARNPEGTTSEFSITEGAAHRVSVYLPLLMRRGE